MLVLALGDDPDGSGGVKAELFTRCSQAVHRSPHRRIDAMDVVVVVEGVEELGDFFAGGLAQFGEVLGEVADFGGD